MARISQEKSVGTLVHYIKLEVGGRTLDGDMLAELQQAEEAFREEPPKPTLWAVDLDNGADQIAMPSRAAALKMVEKKAGQVNFPIKVAEWTRSAKAHQLQMELRAHLEA